MPINQSLQFGVSPTFSEVPACDVHSYSSPLSRFLGVAAVGWQPAASEELRLLCQDEERMRWRDSLRALHQTQQGVHTLGEKAKWTSEGARGIDDLSLL